MTTRVCRICGSDRACLECSYVDAPAGHPLDMGTMQRRIRELEEELKSARHGLDAAGRIISGFSARADEAAPTMAPCHPHGLPFSECAPCLLEQLVYERDALRDLVDSENAAFADRDRLAARVRDLESLLRMIVRECEKELKEKP